MGVSGSWDIWLGKCVRRWGRERRTDVRTGAQKKYGGGEWGVVAIPQ